MNYNRTSNVSDVTWLIFHGYGTRRSWETSPDWFDYDTTRDLTGGGSTAPARRCVYFGEYYKISCYPCEKLGQRPAVLFIEARDCSK